MHGDLHSNEPLFLLPRFDSPIADARFLLGPWHAGAYSPADRADGRSWRLRSVGPMKKLDERMADWGDEIGLYQLPSSGTPASGFPETPERRAACYRAMAGVVRRSETPPPPFAHAANPPGPEPSLSAPLRRFLVVVETDCAGAENTADFNRWYDGIHIPDVLASPHYRSAWRLEIEKPTRGRGRFLTFYEVHTDDIAEAMRIRDSRRVAEFNIGAYEGAKGLVPLATSIFEPLY